MQTERRVAANPQIKPIDLGCESAGRMLPSTSTIAIVIITQPVGLYSFCRPTEGGQQTSSQRWVRHHSAVFDSRGASYKISYDDLTIILR